MRRLIPWFLCVLVLAGHASGEEEAPTASPIDAAVESVLAAHRSGDPDALRARGAATTVDPWLVADGVLARGEPKVAAAFADAVPASPATSSLPAYVRARATAARENPVRDALAKASAAIRREAWQEAADAHAPIEGAPDSVARVRLEHMHAVALAGLGRHREAAAVARTAGEAAEKLGWLGFAARCYGLATVWADQTHERQLVLEVAQARVHVERQLGNASGVAEALAHVGAAQRRLGRPAAAVETLAGALEQAESIGDGRRAARILLSRGIALRALARYDDAVADLQRAVALAGTAKDAPTRANARLNIGLARAEQGNFTAARADIEAALAELEGLDDPARLSAALNGLANVEQQLGRLAQALPLYRRALALAEQVGEPSTIAGVLASLGPLLSKMGRFEEAVTHHRRAAALAEGMGDPARLALALGNLATAESLLGRHEEAVGTLTRALKYAREANDARRETSILLRIGEEEMDRARYPEAQAAYGKAVARAEDLGNDFVLAAALGRLGQLQLGLGDKDAARVSLERAHGLLVDLPGGQEWVLAVYRLAMLRFSEGKGPEAIRLARQAVAGATDLSATLSTAEGGATRDSYADLIGFATYIAAGANYPEALYEIVQMGRASSLRESLGSAGAIERAVLPAALRQELEQARAALHETTGAVRSARARRRLATIRKATAEREAARERLQRVAQRIEREAKQAAALTLSRPATSDDVQALLRPGEALVLYANTPLWNVWIALVIQRDAGWIAFLRSEAPIDTLVDALLSGEQDVDPTQARALKKVLADPLKLGETVRRVILCPTGRLGYVPWSLIFPDRDVALVPSATTLHLLRGQDTARGKGVLALGDPQYKGRPLAPLPATRKEAETVGDVVLLGPKANETLLLEAAASRPRWRAIHLACHGLVDAERPIFSSLALSASAGSDGMLTALEIYGARLPADLVVLSACRTGKGRVYLTEGILGLTRSVMHAGAPRVLCSLWDVDDAATQALMVKFYELWNPKEPAKSLGAAAALRQAQDFIRKQERWQHPRFWAAWVLWGLPD